MSDDNQLSFKFGFLFLYWYRYQIFYLLWVHIVHFNVVLLIDFFSSLNLIFLFKRKYHFIQEYQYFLAILFLTKVNCICWQKFTLCFNYLGFFYKNIQKLNICQSLSFKLKRQCLLYSTLPVNPLHNKYKS